MTESDGHRPGPRSALGNHIKHEVVPADRGNRGQRGGTECQQGEVLVLDVVDQIAVVMIEPDFDPGRDARR